MLCPLVQSRLLGTSFGPRFHVGQSLGHALGREFADHPTALRIDETENGHAAMRQSLVPDLQAYL